MKRESAIRTINRQLEQHRRTFGESSREYQDLLRNLESEIGRPSYNRSGNPFYSRSAGRLYDPNALENAARSVQGSGTAFIKAQEYIRDLLEQGIEPTDENIRQAASIEDEVSQNFEAIYEFLQETENDFDNSDVRMEFAGNRGANAQKRDLVDILQRVTARQGYDSITDVIQQAKQHREQRNDNIRSEAAKSRKSQRLTASEVKQKLKWKGEK